MLLVKTKEELQQKLGSFREFGTVGFVPTMGALHSGHLSLVEKAINENQVVVVSIFVNPTQFNDSKDLERYPRTLESDLKLLKSTGCQFVFAPGVNEIYPKPDRRIFNFGTLDSVMEGKHRSGHFNGVAQVVSRLFEIVKPDKAYFGLKDFQQLAIIKNLVVQLKLPVEIVSCPIIREESGLAMSSRNELLTTEERENAALISRTLFLAKNFVAEKSVEQLVHWVLKTINKNSFLTVEYFEVVDDTRLKPIKSWSEKNTKIGCIAVFCGKIRLIDNIILN
ncbi:MAG: pantoate--beta-alanine ligase [Prolixibacteraceae bacterium]|jgi:pantoate--beta-alanine ligase|nr:pantoate--beta-alanine ligase [Prolixibacteraceae bacterium]MBT6766749.1 pantoate--beta-alanine ligase [Prolixibacteraceae bacterium]MBT6998867.1 pantoate--beta-alanine ligase [Prolixibacteraceae bacterium]MBT7397348.1 pantoate--beta-alanine ligase [Prolixibacteraceae bacterium]